VQMSVTNEMALNRGLALLEKFDTVAHFVTYWNAVGKYPTNCPEIERIR